MKNYEVTLTATSCKTVTLSAESEKAAKKLAGDLYFSSDMLDFNNDDIDEVSIEVNEIENPNERLSPSTKRAFPLRMFKGRSTICWNIRGRNARHCLNKQRIRPDGFSLSRALRP